jgi:hypothetical protein
MTSRRAVCDPAFAVMTFLPTFNPSTRPTSDFRSAFAWNEALASRSLTFTDTFVGRR